MRARVGTSRGHGSSRGTLIRRLKSPSQWFPVLRLGESSMTQADLGRDESASKIYHSKQARRLLFLFENEAIVGAIDPADDS